jgi:hypothetical protein
MRDRDRFMGSAAVFSLVSIFAAGCDDDTVTAQCVMDDTQGYWRGPTVVDDRYCTDHLPDDNGWFFYGGHQYRYYYGSTGGIGSRPRGGSISPPEEDDDGYSPTVRTGSGKTITRGGLGGYGGKGGYGGSGS